MHIHEALPVSLFEYAQCNLIKQAQTAHEQWNDQLKISSLFHEW